MARFEFTIRTYKVGQNLDRLPSLEYLTMKKIYDSRDLFQKNLDVLSKANMVDYALTQVYFISRWSSIAT